MAAQNVVLIFGESPNDRDALRELLLALKPDCGSVQARRSPLVLIKGRTPDKAQHSAEKIAAVVRADQVRSKVRAVVAHQDCDAVEPAHVKISATIEENLQRAGVPSPIAAAPAYEIEAWWYLWPDAVAAVCSRWRKLNRRGVAVGKLIDAKSQLNKDLRPASSSVKAPDYEERHSVQIARNVRQMGIVADKQAKSDSFDRFKSRVNDVL